MPAVGAERQRRHIAPRADEAADLAARLQIPQADGVILRSIDETAGFQFLPAASPGQTEQAAGLRAQRRHGPNDVLMALEQMHLLAGGDVEEADRVVGAAGQEPATVRSELDAG